MLLEIYFSKNAVFFSAFPTTTTCTVAKSLPKKSCVVILQLTQTLGKEWRRSIVGIMVISGHREVVVPRTFLGVRGQCYTSI